MSLLHFDFGIINYFVRRGDKPVKSKRRHKNKDINKGNVNDKVDTKLNASNSKIQKQIK